jgi:teichuronic acid biosynthesis glycosyltransferase TuaC
MTDALWITPSYPWPGDPVAGVFFRTQAQALARQGLAVTVVCPTPWAPWPLPHLRARWADYARAPRRSFDDPVSIIRPRYAGVPREPRQAMPDRVMARVAWAVRKDWAGAKVIHGHYAMTGLAAWRLARQAALPFVLTFHGSDLNSWPDEHRDRMDDLRTAVREAAAVIAVSAALADRVDALTGVTAVHLPIGCDHESLSAAALPRAEARQRLGLESDRLVVLFVGNLLREKGVRELAQAILRLGDPFVGVFLGGGEEAGYGADGADSARRLQYPGPRPHDEVPCYLSAADVLVLPSYSEGLPTVLVEAGSRGVPVIASPVGGIPELLGNDRGTLLSEVSVDAIGSALTEFLARRAEAQASARRLQQYVRDAYDVDRSAERLLECYRSAAPGLGS